MTEERADAAAKRAEARERRRQNGDAAAPSDEHSDARQAAKAAAAAAAVGAAVGAVRALASRGGGDDDDRRSDERVEAHEPPHAEVDEVGEAGEAGEAGTEQAAPARAAAPDRVRAVAQNARALLQELAGVEPESVSGLDRTPEGWRVTVEVVEVRRIPESTDVLATYDVELDEDGDLLRYERRRRYYRSQSDAGRDE